MNARACQTQLFTTPHEGGGLNEVVPLMLTVRGERENTQNEIGPGSNQGNTGTLNPNKFEDRLKAGLQRVSPPGVTCFLEY